MAHLWSGRFAGDPDADLFAFGSSFRFDRRLFEDDVRGSRAWAAGLAHAGVLSAAEAAAIEQGLGQMLEQGTADPAYVSDAHGDEDVHAFVERELIARIGDAGRRLHTGRSRTEQGAAALGFSRIARNSIDVSGDRDFVASFLHAASLGMVHLSRIAEDFILFTSEEFGFFELADEAATGSSLMPQKKNPDPLELVRGKSGRVIGHLTGWLVTMKGLPAGYNKDLQEDKEALFDTEDTWLGCLRAVSRVLAGLTPNAEASGQAASGLLLATDVADYLVAKGLPFRDAHEVVGAIVRRLLAEGRAFDELSLAEWRQHSPLFAEDVRTAITPLASVEKKQTPQSTSPTAVAAALSETLRWLTAQGL